MDDILKALQAIIDNPDDVSGLPNVITRLQEIKATHTQAESDYQDRIMKLQDANRNLLSQIPIHTGEEGKAPDEPEVTFEDAQEQLLNAMKNVGGY